MHGSHGNILSRHFGPMCLCIMVKKLLTIFQKGIIFGMEFKVKPQSFVVKVFHHTYTSFFWAGLSYFEVCIWMCGVRGK
jgi:hypothetical protein